MALCESNGTAICFNKLTSELHLSKLTLTSSISSKPPSINNLSSFVNRICNLFCLSSFFNFYILFMCLHHWKRSSIFIHKHNKQMTLRLFTLTLMVTTSLPTLTVGCQFPSSWKGVWFQKGVPDSIRISNNNISEKGFCRENFGEKFLIENRNEKCVRCMVINERHNNLLQYKETYQCHPLGRGRIYLDNVCSEINGDAPLFSLFRLDAKPIPCPFQGPFKFTYNRGQGECSYPQSTIDTCTDDSHLQFRFQACHDVPGTESREEALECYAEWKEGSYHYLVGKMYHQSAKTDEDKFRCFVFDKINNGFEIAQSGDATCDGLLSPKDGSRTMKLHKAADVSSECKFPSWLTSMRNWKSLDGSHTYELNNQQNNSFLVYNSTDGKIVRHGLCVQNDINFVNVTNVNQFVIHLKYGCKSKFVCMRIFKRAKQIIEIIYGNQVNHMNEACLYFEPQNFDITYHTLTSKTTETQECPFGGIYAVNVPGGNNNRPMGVTSDRTLISCSEQSFNSKCNANDHMQLESRCGYKDTTRNFRCLGGWNENGTNYLIASSNEDMFRKYCLVYNKFNGQIHMTISSATCVRSIINYKSNTQLNYKDSHMGLILTFRDDCSSSLSSTSNVHIISISNVLKHLILFHIVLLFCKFCQCAVH